MNNADLIDSINLISKSIIELNNSVERISTTYWWDTQWFATLIGALAAFVGTFLFSKIKERTEELSELYQWFLRQGTFSDPETLLGKALIIQYQGEDKQVSEKMIIELRSHVKYWRAPIGCFRFLMGSYEKSLRKIGNGQREEIVNQDAYKKAEIQFEKVMNFVYKKTGENEWTS